MFSMPPFYSPHGGCFQWDWNLIALHRWSDILIALSYFTIPIVLAIFLLGRKEELGFRTKTVIGITAAFIISCGSTHVMGWWNITHSDYWFEGWVKAVTAAVSVPAAIIYILGLKAFLTFRNPISILQGLASLKVKIAEYESAKSDLKAAGFYDPRFALLYARVTKAEKDLKENHRRMEELVKLETKNRK